jgi:hypothetical protein
MIQRFQTIFFLLAGISFGTMFKLPLATSDTASAMFLADKVYDITDHPVLIGLSALGIALALVAIFLFRNRALQIRLGYMIIITAILLPIVAFWLFTNESAHIDPNVIVHDEMGMFLPGGAILFGALANYFIKKDERLVKSMDRLR